MVSHACIGKSHQRATEAVAAAAPAIDERVGIIRFVSDRAVEPDDPRIFQAATGVTNAARLYGTAAATPTGHSGAGLTREIAMAGAIGESLERYCSGIYDEQTLVVASYAELEQQGTKATAPHTFALYSDSQYARPEFIHHPFTENTMVCWTPGFSLVCGEPVLVPACLVYVPYRFQNHGDLIAFGVSTGLSCARSVPEAILGGLYEVVERDAIMIMWMNRLRCPRIEFDSGSWLTQVVRERFAPSRLEICLNDITSDLPIPVVFALLIDRKNEGLAVVAGASANLDPQAAALKALVEAAQGRRWLRNMNERHLMRTYRNDFADVINFDDHVRLFGWSQSIGYVDFLINGPFRSVKKLGGDDPVADLKRCLGTLVARNLDAIVVNLTQPDVAALGFTVVKVLVPGLVDIHADHNYPFLGGDRLYTVPRRLGLLNHDVQETDLNPVPHPFP